jgi:glycosyltransferase involved in cell wall biosynthesis
MMDQSLVSVIIPTYNSASYLPETLASVFAQTHGRLEVVVVDDGSTDDTPALLRSYGDRIVSVRQENWGGPSRPRNVGVDHARGDMIAFFDSDDLMEADKIAASVEAFARYPEAGLLFSNFRAVDETGRIVDEDFLSRYREFRADLEPDGPDLVRVLRARPAYSRMLRANFIGTSSVVCRRAALEEAGPFDESMLNADDIDMWRRIAWAGHDFIFLDRVLHSYRKRGGGVTARGVGRYPAVLRGLAKQLDLELGADERAYVIDRLHGLRLEFGRALSVAGRHGEARRVYRECLGERVSARGLKGWLRSLLRL